jgi:hypothetical protein
VTISQYPTSIREINDLPEGEKVNIYRTLIPTWILHDFGIDSDTFMKNNHKLITFRFPSGSRAIEITVKRDIGDIDPLLYLNMADTFNNQLLVLLVQVNDPNAPRFDTDIDEHGNPTNFGTTSRNIPVEVAAMEYGLAPGQIRSGLRSFRKIVPIFEEFVKHMGYDMFFIEPLAYHNAIVFERYGFSYLHGLSEMERINQKFQINGEYYKKLDDNNPFRKTNAWKTIRGRSWAIHDGILDHAYTGFRMYKRLGKNAGINTFPDAIW